MNDFLLPGGGSIGETGDLALSFYRVNACGGVEHYGGKSTTEYYSVTSRYFNRTADTNGWTFTCLIGGTFHIAGAMKLTVNDKYDENIAGEGTVSLVIGDEAISTGTFNADYDLKVGDTIKISSTIVNRNQSVNNFVCATHFLTAYTV